MGTRTDFRHRILAVRLSVGVVTSVICLMSAACASTPPRQTDVVVASTPVASPVATVPPANLTMAPTVPPTLAVVPIAIVPPTSVPVRVPTAPPAPRPTATVVPTVVPSLPDAAIPVSITIPRLHSAADIVPLGLEADGTMAVPSDPDTIGWYDFSAQVGRPGNVVVVGHVDWGGRLRAFGLLRDLRAGDQVTIVDALDRDLTYRVQTVDLVSADAPPDAYLTQNGPQEQLTLITCGGTFDHASHQYVSRVIVRAFRDADL